MQRLAGTALDFLVVAAISTIRIEVVAENWVPFVIIIVGGIFWNLFCVLWLAKRLLPNCWFERAIAEMGQSMGVTATGLLLLRAVDPENKTEAASAFGYKQLLHEPFMGGGLWTSSAVIIVAAKGGWVVLGISLGAIAAWLAVCKLFLNRS
jgi:ESS family glutamate:Na+ symporter